MYDRIALNWLPFGAASTGAKRRAVELHRRLPEFRFAVFTTRGLPEADRLLLPNAEFHDVADARSLGARWAESRAGWWRPRVAAVGACAWVTDTLPVVHLPGVRTLFTVHDLRYRVDRRYVSVGRQLLHRVYMRSSLARADAVVAVSEWTAGEVRRLFGVSDDRLHVVPNGVDAPQGAGDSRDADGATHDRAPFETPYVLSVGHLEPRKNQVLLIDALAAIGDRWPGRLVLVGRDLGTGRALARRAAELGVTSRVVLTGTLTDDALESAYRHAALVACPSRYEGFGMTVLEAFARRRPVAASDIGPHREIAGDAVEWFDPEGAGAAVAERLLAVLESEAHAESLVRRGVAVARARSWDAAAERLRRAYASLADAASAARR